MTEYKISPQENEYWCFPACLQAVLRRHNIEETQRNIAEFLQVDSEGAKLPKVSEFLRQKGFDFIYYQYNAVPFNEPDFFLRENSRRGADIIVAIPGKRLNHILLMTEFKDPILTLLDPEGRMDGGNLYDILKDMHQRQTGGFGIVDRLGG